MSEGYTGAARWGGVEAGLSPTGGVDASCSSGTDFGSPSATGTVTSVSEGGRTTDGCASP